MNWINFSTALAIIVASIVFLQGWSILRRESKTMALTILGFLTILLSLLGFLFEFLYTTTGIVISSEFLTIMVQEGWPNVLFSLLAIGLALFFSLSFYLLFLVSIPKLAESRLTVLGTLATAIFVGWVIFLVGRQQISGNSGAPQVYVYHHLWIWVYLAILTIGILVSVFLAIGSGGLGDFKAVISEVARQINQYKWMPHVILILLVGLVIIVYDFELPGPALGVIIFLAAWAALTEIITVGALETLYESIRKGRIFSLDERLARYRARSKKEVTHPDDPGTSGHTLTSRASNSSGESKESAWSALLKVLMGFILIVFLSDVFNAGKTIIHPFRGIGNEEDAIIADSINERLINNLAQLNQQLQPGAILLNTSGNNISIIQPSDTDGTIDTIAAGSGSLELGSIKIPLSVLVSPLRNISRPIFNIRAVEGTILSENGNYILLANASDGKTWIVKTSQDQSNQAVPALVEEMAFQILISEPELGGVGITDNWEAFDSFRRGAEELEKYEHNNDYQALVNAIQALQDAVEKDQQFAMAHYRLGLALQQNKQPWLAEMTLRKSLAINPESIAFQNALAYHLYFFDYYSPNVPAVMPVSEPQNDQAKKQEARRLWFQIIGLPDRQAHITELASAYSGLCRNSTDIIIENLDRGIRPDDLWLAYFYCYRSQNLLERIPVELQDLEIVHQAKVENLNNLGVIIGSQAGYLTKQFTDKEFFCQGFNYDAPTVPDWYFSTKNSRSALIYFENALAIQPQDYVIQCNAAIHYALLDNPELEDDVPDRMSELGKTAQAHYQLGLQYLHEARKQSPDADSPSRYYEAAIREFQRAIVIDPMHHEALNNFAYTYWVFRLRWPQEDPQSLGIKVVSSLAEYYARKAVHVAQIQQDDYLEILYTKTLGEVLLANGKILQAEWILAELVRGEDPKVPDSYIFDELRWDLAQASLCLSKTDLLEDPRRWDLRSKHAEKLLNKIRENEKEVDLRLYSQPHRNYLKTYRLPFDGCYN